MTLPKLTGIEHICALVAAGGATLLLAPAVVPDFVKWVALLGGLGVGGASFALRQGWRPSL